MNMKILQMCCDSSFRITNVVAKWPGLVHDSRMFRNSVLCQESKTVGFYFDIILVYLWPG